MRRARRSGCAPRRAPRSEEHTSELQSHLNLVCRLLLEKKKTDEIRFRVVRRTRCMPWTWSIAKTHYLDSCLGRVPLDRHSRQYSAAIEGQMQAITSEEH